MADADPMWSSTPDTIPLTPDEDRTNTTRQERGRMQIEMIQALAAMRATGIQVPPEAMWLLEREIPEGVLRGTVLCANSHDNPAGRKVLRGVRRVHGRPRCHRPPGGLSQPPWTWGGCTSSRCGRCAGTPELPDKGSKDDLIGRLQAAA